MTKPYMSRFHKTYPGMEDLWHTYCEDHPTFGTCSTEAEAHRAIATHLENQHTGVDTTPPSAYTVTNKKGTP